MYLIKRLFPISFSACDIKSLAITILIYLVADFICGCIIGFFGKLPLIGFVFSIIGWIAGIYFFAGIVIAVLNFLGVLKN
uniref:hypothetical protein n=1 Tax=Agathobacter sp. TaxID=2021311 RepID=UPI004055BA0E